MDIFNQISSTGVFILFIFIINCEFTNGQIPVQPPAQQMQQQAVPLPPLDPDVEKALYRYEQLKEKYPEKTELNYNLGNMNYLIGDYETALKEYQSALSETDSVKRSHTLYNIGNSLIKSNNIQESVDFYKKALELNSDDEDIKHNYELSKILLQQQEQQQDQECDGGENKEEQEQEQQEKQQNKQQSDEKQEQDEQSQAEQNEDESDEQEQQQQEQAEEQNEEESEQRAPQPQELTEEEKLDREEAEAILNALKANEKNMMKKKYHANGRITVEKDW